MSEAPAAAAVIASSRLPRRFGRYALFDFVGKGGMAEIFLARAHTELGAARLCVVKQILPEFAHHPQFAEMLIHEAKLAARLNHANIVQVFDLGREGDQLFIAMEYVEGFDLNALLRRCSQSRVPLPLEFALRIVCDALTGLDYAHRRKSDEGEPLGIVHRDVSPSNILISIEGEVKLCDFGIAHANDIVVSKSTGDLDDAIKGKAGYMSPEHARGEPIDARADVFAVGIVLWELLMGRRMYRKESEVPLLDQARGAMVPPLVSKGLPHEERLYGIVQKALAAKREDRYPSAGAMLRDLEAYMMEAKLVASPLKLGEWIASTFGAELDDQKRARERLTPVPSQPPASLTHSAPPSLGTPSTSRVSSRTTPVPSQIPASTSSSPPAPVTPVVEVVRADPDPPSLAAATVDVSPSSSLRGRPAFSDPPVKKRGPVVVLALVAVVVVAGLALFFLTRYHG
jgi:serine/threonine-protein kinase